MRAAEAAVRPLAWKVAVLETADIIGRLDKERLGTPTPPLTPSESRSFQDLFKIFKLFKHVPNTFKPPNPTDGQFMTL
jgi:hypothetical protein